MARFRWWTVITVALAIFACGGGKGDGTSTPPADPDAILGGITGGNPGGDAFVIADNSQLIGGPLADARRGDIYVQNDKIRLILDQPGSQNSAFGGTTGCKPIDLDLRRNSAQAGQDNLLAVFPLINLEWTVNYQSAEILEDDIDIYGFVRVRCTGVIQVQEYLPTSLIIPNIKAKAGYTGFYPTRFQNALDPFNKDPRFTGLEQTIVTDYILYRGASYFEMKNTIVNKGSKPIDLPLGYWFSAAGFMEYFIPSVGYANPFLAYSIGPNYPGIVFSSYDDGLGSETKVSYSYLYDPRPFAKIDPTARKGAALAVQGVTLMVPGQMPFLIDPSASGLVLICDLVYPDTKTCPTDADSKINAPLPANTAFTYSTYVGVGDGSVSKALDAAMSGLGIPYATVSGQVVDAAGAPVPQARVALLDTDSDNGGAATIFLTDSNGTFSGRVANGGDDWLTNNFGSGKYQVLVYKEGYLADKEAMAGVCLSASTNKDTIDVTGQKSLSDITCTLGKTVAVVLGDVLDADSGQKIPATLSILGSDPSPRGTSTLSYFGDSLGFYQMPYGMVDTLYYHPNGTWTGFEHRPNGRTLYLEPGTYEFTFYRGTEYALVAKKVTVTADSKLVLGDIRLKRAVPTPGYISMDFHVHSRNSMDVPIPQDIRLLNGAAFGMDLFSAADHDVVTSYDSSVARTGLGNWINAWPGEEVTPLLMGHFLATGVDYDPDDLADGGSLDYVHDERDTVGAGRDYNVSLPTILEQLHEASGETFVQMAHITDHGIGYMYLNGLVTSNGLSTDPLSLFSDPLEFRLGDPPAGDVPFPYLSVEHSSMNFDGVELAFSDEFEILDHLMEQALPAAFNLFNLGKLATMTINSDPHQLFMEPLGGIRNYCRSDIDPLDGRGNYSDFSDHEKKNQVIRNIKAQHCFITSGPYLAIDAANAQGQTASFGDTLSVAGAQTVALNMTIKAPKWIEWDTVEVYINTVPTPLLESDMSEEEFSRESPYYTMTPAYTFSTQDKTLSVTVSGDVRSSALSHPISVTEDSWIVVMVKGSDGVSNPIFPLSPVELGNTGDTAPAKLVDTFNNRFVAESVVIKGGYPSYAIGNPIYIDTDGDTNHDGVLFESMYIRDGTSPLAK